MAENRREKRTYRVCRSLAALALAFLFAVSGSMQAFAAYPLQFERKNLNATVAASRQGELRGVWISYLDWDQLPSREEDFQIEVNRMLDRCVELGMNAVFVHVRPDADAMYPSNYFPWSRFVTGTQGQDPGYDPLSYFIDAAHKREMQFHAWINPYRVTGYLNVWDQVSEQSPARRWLSDADPENDRWVLKQNGAYYFNPAVPQVQELIVNGVREITERYPVDGIHFDDYFYPEIDDSNPDRWFDKPEYDASGSTLPIAEWRRENINQLVRAVYRTVKEKNPELVFGISPEGYVEHLRSDKRLFADVDTWLSQDGYVDYIMPQIYWGFEHRLSDKSPAPFAFSQNLKTWIALKKKGNAKLYLGLAMYKAGSSSADNNEISEWSRHDDIISRQVEEGRASGQVSGCCFYAYSSFQEEACQKEVKNLVKLFR